MWKIRREQRTHVLAVLKEVQVPMWYKRKTSNPTSPRIRTMTKESLRARIKPPTQPTSRGKPSIRRKGTATFVALLDIGLLIALNAMIGVGTAASLQVLLLVILR